MSKRVLDLTGVKRTFHQGRQDLEILRGVDLAVNAGEIVALVGPSGAGKSTLLHIAGLLEPFDAGDPVSSAAILDILQAYVAHGGTVILSSHGMELVERVCSRVAVIVAGALVAEGTVDEVRGEGSLEERFVELVGGAGALEGLEWLHTFSD